MCYLKDQETLEKNKINKYPEILIIIINNKNKCKINFKQTIKLNDYEYNLIIGIIKSDRQNVFDIIYYINSKINEEKRDNFDPYVLFCKKGKEIK